MWESQEIRWGQMCTYNGLPRWQTLDGNTINQFAYKLSAGTLVSLTEQLSLDVNYQYVNLGAFKAGTEFIEWSFSGNLQRALTAVTSKPKN